MKFRTALLIITILSSAALFAQEDSTRVISVDVEPVCIDTTDVDMFTVIEQPELYFIENKTMTESFFEKRIVQSTFVGVPLFLAGLIEMAENDHFQSVRNDFLPTFKHEYENYLQYTPVIAMFTMKALGVKGQSSWTKMITADVASGALMYGIAKTIKHTAKERRPDGTNNKSFPSGHTATAFMAATMLAKEYGYISPWIPIAGYSVATATGVMRMVNNRHWMSDVLAGAGIGIVSTEFGYWIADILFPNSKKSYDPKYMTLSSTDNTPSFFGLYAGFYSPLRTSRLTEKIRSSSGGTAGFEGAWFWNHHWGVGGQWGVSDMNYVRNNKEDIVGSVHFCTTQVGCYYALPLFERLYIRAKAITGCVFYPQQNEEYVSEQRKVGHCVTSGITLGLRTHQHLDFHIGCDYSSMQSYNKYDKSHYHTLILSGGATIRF